MKHLIVILLSFMLTGCSITDHYNEYSVRINTESGSDFELHKVNTKIKLSSNRKHLTIKYPNHKVKYDVFEYRYIYPRYIVFKSRRDRRGVMVETANGTLISLYFGGRFANVSVPSNDGCDLIDTLYQFNYNYNYND